MNGEREAQTTQERDTATAEAETGEERAAPPSGTAEIAAAARERSESDADVHEAIEHRLLASDVEGSLRDRWESIQARFVDDPQASVREADTLVAEVMQKLAEMFASERAGLERQWSEGGEATTEDLRIALQKYRAFFDRLLTLQGPPLNQ
jgi:hypothetical protein